MYDPEDYGVGYDIQYRGKGRLDDPFSDHGMGRFYHPFTDSQLKAALRDPGSAPPGLLPSFTALPPPYVNEHRKYIDQSQGNQAPAVPLSIGASPAARPAPPVKNAFDNGLADWIASLAGVDPVDPTQPQQGGSVGGNPPKQRLLPPWVFFGSP